MTDRLNALTVILDHDIRSDDAEPLIAAIELLRGVLKVTPHVVDLADHIAYARARSELGERLWQALQPDATKG